MRKKHLYFWFPLILFLPGIIFGETFEQGFAFQEKGQYQKAAEYYRLSLRENPNRAATYFNLAVSLSHLPDYQQSVMGLLEIRVYYRQFLEKIAPSEKNDTIRKKGKKGLMLLEQHLANIRPFPGETDLSPKIITSLLTQSWESLRGNSL